MVMNKFDSSTLRWVENVFYYFIPNERQNYTIISPPPTPFSILGSRIWVFASFEEDFAATLGARNSCSDPTEGGKRFRAKRRWYRAVPRKNRRKWTSSIS